MKTNRIVTFLLSNFLLISAFAQTQQGYVKTLGRPDKKGVALSGVTVRVKGGHNAVQSQQDGTFSMLLTGKKNGDGYQLQQVQKTGYELNEKGVIGRQYAFSDKVPLTIVMVSTAQLQADKQRIENNAYQVAEKNYKTKLALLEQQRESNAITAEQYRQQLQDLQDKFEKYQSLIDDLSDHYAHVDYDNLDEQEREINQCIENGDLERADSLIHVLFDPVDVLKRNMEALSKIEEQMAQAQALQAQAYADMAAVLKQQEKDAEHLYQLYTIALARYDNEKALFYIETRAELDTTNVDWQNEAGMFITDYMSDCDKALAIYQRALNSALAAEGKEIDVATCHNNIGMAYCTKGEYQKALESLTLAAEIYISQTGEQHPNVALAYNNIANAYQGLGDTEKALMYLEKSLQIRKDIFGEDNLELAVNYNNIGFIFSAQGNWERAMEYLSKALEIRRRALGEQHQDLAFTYSNLGNVYIYQGKMKEGQENFQKALEIFNRVFGMEHPYVSLVLNNIGYIYQQKGDYDSALQYYIQSADILKRLFGELNAELGQRYNNVGEIYRAKGDYIQALSYYQQADSILEKALPPSHPTIGILHNNLGIVNYLMKNYDVAEKHYSKAMEILKAAYNERHFYVGLVYYNTACLKRDKGNLADALPDYQKALDIRREVFGDTHMDVAITCNDIAKLYEATGDYLAALKYYQDALSSMEGVAETTDQRFQTLLTNIKGFFDTIGSMHGDEPYKSFYEIFTNKYGGNVQ